MNMSSPAYRGREFSDSRKVSIRPFRFGDESAFRKLNERWISQYFKVEEADEKVFSDPVGQFCTREGRSFLRRWVENS